MHDFQAEALLIPDYLWIGFLLSTISEQVVGLITSGPNQGKTLMDICTPCQQSGLLSNLMGAHIVLLLCMPIDIIGILSQIWLSF